MTKVISLPLTRIFQLEYWLKILILSYHSSLIFIMILNPNKKVTGLLMITIDQLVFFLLFRRFSRGICMTKCIPTLTSSQSPFLFAFRKGFSTRYCLIGMLDKWKRQGALLTDLSKAFDCLNHELLIDKLEGYDFNKYSLTYVYSYLWIGNTERK